MNSLEVAKQIAEKYQTPEQRILCASEKIVDGIFSLQKLGFSKEEILDLISSTWKQYNL